MSHNDRKRSREEQPCKKKKKKKSQKRPLPPNDDGRDDNIGSGRECVDSSEPSTYVTENEDDEEIESRLRKESYPSYDPTSLIPDLELGLLFDDARKLI